MKKFILIIMVVTLALANVCSGSATSVNIAGKPTGDWLKNGGIKDLAWRWMQEIDGLVAAGGQIGTGKIFYVDSNVTNEGDGFNWLNAKDTIDEAMNLCTASRGDRIYVAQGHAETTAATLVACDVIGVTIIGIGSGTLTPALTLTHADAIAFLVTAADVTISNIYIDATGADSVDTPIDIGAKRCTLDNIEMLMADGTGQADNGVTTSGAANAADYLTITNCRFISPDAGANEAILLEEVEEGVIISDCYIYGDFVVAPIHNPTGKILTNLLIKKCLLKNDQTGDFALELVSACTGMLVENYYHSDAAATAVDPGSCFSFECYGIDAVDESAFVRPAVGTP